MSNVEHRVAIERLAVASRGGLRGVAGLKNSKFPEVQKLANVVIDMMESPSASFDEVIESIISKDIT